MDTTTRRAGAVGTDGDVFPNIGLGVASRARGHRVTLTAPEPFHTRATSFGLEFPSLVTTEEYERASFNRTAAWLIDSIIGARFKQQ